MGTKNNPGPFDCYAKLDPDEPYFVLRGKDPSAAALVMLWSGVRSRNGQAINQALDMLRDCMTFTHIMPPQADDDEKVTEALKCSHAMVRWLKVLPNHPVKDHGDSSPSAPENRG